MSWYLRKTKELWTFLNGNILIVWGGPVQYPEDGSHDQHDQTNATPHCGSEHWGKEEYDDHIIMTGQDMS